MLSSEEAARRGRIGGFVRSSRYDPQTLTAVARSAAESKLDARLLAGIDPHGLLDERERLRRLTAARRAHFSRLAQRSAKVRAARRAEANS